MGWREQSSALILAQLTPVWRWWRARMLRLSQTLRATAQHHQSWHFPKVGEGACGSLHFMDDNMFFGCLICIDCCKPLLHFSWFHLLLFYSNLFLSVLYSISLAQQSQDSSICWGFSFLVKVKEFLCFLHRWRASCWHPGEASGCHQCWKHLLCHQATHWQEIWWCRD